MPRYAYLNMLESLCVGGCAAARAMSGCPAYAVLSLSFLLVMLASLPAQPAQGQILRQIGARKQAAASP